MNGALWDKSWRDARLLWSSLAVVAFGFPWLYVWITGMIEIEGLAQLLRSILPPGFEKLLGVPFASATTRTGIISMVYVHPVVEFIILTWSLARGSDAVSGEIGRGTMEMLLAQPVRRSAVLAVQAAVTLLGAAGLALAIWLGTWAGIQTVPLKETVEIGRFVPGALNIFSLMVFLAGISTLVSSWDNYRWRTLGVVGGFFLIALVIKVVARLRPGSEWLIKFSFLGAFEPQALIVNPETAWEMSLQNDGILLGLGVLAYVAAGVIFCRRDLPAPL